MNKPTAQHHILLGIVLAVAATIIWSGNFIIARAINKEISPVALSFFRWFCQLFPLEGFFIQLNILLLVAFCFLILHQKEPYLLPPIFHQQ